MADRDDWPPGVPQMSEEELLALTARCDLFRAAAASPANRELRGIARDLRALVGRMAAWSAAHADCECVFCQASGNQDGHINHTLAGGCWAMQVVADQAERETSEPKGRRQG